MLAKGQVPRRFKALSKERQKPRHKKEYYLSFDNPDIQVSDDEGAEKVVVVKPKTKPKKKRKYEFGVTLDAPKVKDTFHLGDYDESEEDEVESSISKSPPPKGQGGQTIATATQKKPMSRMGSADSRTTTGTLNSARLPRIRSSRPGLKRLGTASSIASGVGRKRGMMGSERNLFRIDSGEEANDASASFLQGLFRGIRLFADEELLERCGKDVYKMMITDEEREEWKEKLEATREKLRNHRKEKEKEQEEEIRREALRKAHLERRKQRKMEMRGKRKQRRRSSVVTREVMEARARSDSMSQGAQSKIAGYINAQESREALEPPISPRPIVKDGVKLMSAVYKAGLGADEEGVLYDLTAGDDDDTLARLTTVKFAGYKAPAPGIVEAAARYPTKLIDWRHADAVQSPSAKQREEARQWKADYKYKGMSKNSTRMLVSKPVDLDNLPQAPRKLLEASRLFEDEDLNLVDKPVKEKHRPMRFVTSRREVGQPVPESELLPVPLDPDSEPVYMKGSLSASLSDSKVMNRRKSPNPYSLMIRPKLRFSQADIKRIRKDYEDVIADSRHRVLDLTTFTELANRCGVTDVAAEQMFGFCDTKKFGFVSFQQFLESLDELKNGSNDNRLHAYLKLYDLDGNGNIDRGELYIIFKESPLNKDKTKDEIKRMVDTVFDVAEIKDKGEGIDIPDMVDHARNNEKLMQMLQENMIDVTWRPETKVTTEKLTKDVEFVRQRHGSFLRRHSSRNILEFWQSELSDEAFKMVSTPSSPNGSRSNSIAGSPGSSRRFSRLLSSEDDESESESDVTPSSQTNRLARVHGSPVSPQPPPRGVRPSLLEKALLASGAERERSNSIDGKTRSESRSESKSENSGSGATSREEGDGGEG